MAAGASALTSSGDEASDGAGAASKKAASKSSWARDGRSGHKRHECRFGERRSSSGESVEGYFKY